MRTARSWLMAAIVAMVALSHITSASAAAAAIASIQLTTPNTTLSVGGSETIRAVARDAHGRAIPVLRLGWTSSNNAVVRVAGGLIKGIAPGTAIIRAASGRTAATVAINVVKATSLSGLAAKGSAIANATVTLVDKNGTVRTTATASDGSYSLSTTGLKPPFLVAVQVAPGTILYSVSADASANTVVNVTPLTDLIVRSWYGVQSVDTDTAFSNPAVNPAPPPSQVALIGNVVVQVTSLWLQQAGVDTSSFNPISTPFDADGTGVDAVLDEANVDTGTGTITITDGTTSQTSTVSYDTGVGSMSVDTTTTGPDGSSSSVTGTVVATSSDTQTALVGITNALNSFAATVNSKGGALKDSDLLPFLDDNLLNEGLSESQFAASTADQLRGQTISFAVQNVAALDAAGGTADVNFSLTGSKGGQTQTQSVEFFFKKQGNGSWLLFGDQLPAKLNVDSEMRTNQGAFASDNGPDINVDIRPLEGVYSAVSIDGAGGDFADTPLTKQGQIEVDTYTPDPAHPGTTVEVDRDVFFANTGVLGSLVPAGSDVTVTLTPASGPAQQFALKTNAFTTEAISITNLSDSSLAGANLGGTLHVEWTLPKTFAIAQVKLGANVFTADFQCNIDHPVTSSNSTSADVSLPSTCSGETVTSANLNLNVIGVNGEREIVIYEFQD